jgi:hypothetical protein
MLLKSFGSALLAQCHPKIWLMSLLPMIGSVLVWGVVLYFTLVPLIDHLQALVLSNDSFNNAGSWLKIIGLFALKAFLAPLLALWVILPMIMISAMLVVGALLMPLICNFVAGRDFPTLEKKMGGTLLGGLMNGLLMFVGFVLLWLISLPLTVIPPLALLAHTLLWGWLTYRIMIYDALADHATVEERQAITRQYRLPLLVIGTITSVAANLATLLWLGGAVAVLFLPVTSILAIWLYFVVFIFSGLWFQYFSLAALQAYRAQRNQEVNQLENQLENVVAG